MLRRTGFKNKQCTPLRRTPLRKVGRVGKANLLANKKLKDVLAGIEYCEMRLDGCLGGMFLQRAHRHKRAYYKGDVDKLSAYNQVVVACQNCHEKTEHNRELNEEIFNKLRGEETT